MGKVGLHLLPHAQCYNADGVGEIGTLIESWKGL